MNNINETILLRLRGALDTLSDRYDAKMGGALSVTHATDREFYTRFGHVTAMGDIMRALNRITAEERQKLAPTLARGNPV